MTVQTQGQQVFGPTATAPVRGVRGFVLGIAAIIAAGTAIGFAVSADTPRPVVIAPHVYEETAPQAEQRAALNRLHQEALSAARLAAYERLEAATWAK